MTVRGRFRALPLAAAGLAGWCAAIYPVQVHAQLQTQGPGQTTPSQLSTPMSTPMSTPTQAQAQASEPLTTGNPPLRLTPSVSLVETITDNRALSTDKRADAITEGRFNLNAILNSPRLRGFADYGLSATAYAREDDLNDLRQRLAAAATADLVRNRATVDLRASIDQSLRSVYGTRSPNGQRGDDNELDTATASVSPAWSSRIAGLVDFDARYAYEITNTRGTDRGDGSVQTAQVRLGDIRRRLMWSVEAQHQRIDFVEGRDTVLESAQAGIGFQPDPDLSVMLTGGTERTDLVSVDKETHSTYGAQIRWTPTDRTLVQARYQHRFFGHSHAVSLSHRTPRTAWSFSDARSLSTGDGQAQVRLGTVYELLFQQFASIEPDPTRRDILVRNFLATRGTDPRLDVQASLLVSAVTLEREQSLAATWMGRRTTATVRLSRDRSEALSRLDSDAALGDLASGAIRQESAALNVSHQLTPVSAVDLTTGWTRSRGEGSGSAAGSDSSARLRTVLLNWSTQLAPRSALSVGVRHARYDSPTAPYTENAVIAAFSHRF